MFLSDKVCRLQFSNKCFITFNGTNYTKGTVKTILGYQLPNQLPSELASIFPNSRDESVSPAFDAAGNAVSKKTTFDDKFRDSYARGEAELERRRQIAREEEERLKAESDRREREERERRERERQEIERRREAEREAERQRELERERARQEEEARQRAEREAIRKKLEEERMKELEKIRIRELENQKETEAEKTAQIQQRHKNMSFQLQALQEKSDGLNNDVTQARDEIIAITSEIEGMRGQRDEKLATMNQMQQTHQQLSVQCERVSHEYLQLQSESRHSLNRAEEIEQLKKLIVERNDEIVKTDEEFAAVRVKLGEVEKLVEEKMPQFKESNSELAKDVEAYNELVKKVKARQDELRKKATEKSRASFAETSALSTSMSNHSDGFGNNFAANFDNAFNDKDPFANAAKADFDPFGAGGSVPSTATHDQFGDPFAPAANTGGAPTVTGVPTKYRALFEFTARSDDELSLKPNDIILVFDSQTTAEPGWLAGQVRGKVGWFPEAFTEPVANSKKSVNTVSSPSSEPLASITEEPVEKDTIHDLASAFAPTTAPNGIYDTPPTIPSLYETPPVEIAPAAAAVAAAVAPEPTSVSLPQYDAPPVLPAVSSPPNYDTPPVPVASSPATYDAPPLLPPTSLPSYDAPPGDVPAADKVIAIGVALYRWNAQKDGDLSFGKGDEIEILEQGEMKWRGRLLKNPSTQGWFPKSYVKLNDPVASPVKSQTSPTATSPIKNGTAPAPPTGEWYVALWDFDAAEPTDLTIRHGDRIWVIDRQEQWWKGVLDGKTGIFPATYVEKASPGSSQGPPPMGASDAAKDSVGRALADFDAAADNQISLKVGELIKIISTSPTGWWEGEVTSPSGEKRTGWFPGNYIELVTDATSPVNGSLT
uniref:SH3 domain-containing protein n=1 Tax=Panagrellus redivivus TaxID=6233 RepID=A0A7E4UXI2_PANRE